MRGEGQSMPPVSPRPFRVPKPGDDQPLLPEALKRLQERAAQNQVLAGLREQKHEADRVERLDGREPYVKGARQKEVYLARMSPKARADFEHRRIDL